MIFVTVGTHTQSFDRLIVKMDEVSGKIDEEVIIQIGCSKYRPAHATHFSFVNHHEFLRLCQEARLVVCHAGVGTILTVKKLDKPLLLVPRLKRYGESIDDHQLEIAEVMDGHNRTKAVHDMDDMIQYVNGDFGAGVTDTGRNKLSVALKEMLPGICRCRSL